jgi:hypothetical protein
MNKYAAVAALLWTTPAVSQGLDTAKWEGLCQILVASDLRSCDFWWSDLISRVGPGTGNVRLTQSWITLKTTEGPKMEVRIELDVFKVTAEQWPIKKLTINGKPAPLRSKSSCLLTQSKNAPQPVSSMQCEWDSQGTDFVVKAYDK